MTNVAYCVHALGEIDKSIVLYEIALEISRKVFNDDYNPSIATVINHLGQAWFSKGILVIPFCY